MAPAISKRKFDRARTLSFAWAALVACAACTRSVPADTTLPLIPAPAPSLAASLSSAPALTSAPALSSAAALASASASASPSPPRAPLASRTDGPHDLPLAPGRTVFYARPLDPPPASLAVAGAPPWRVVGHLHGICYPPSYSAGRWLGAAVDVGVLVSPSGNARCGDANVGPPSWEAPSWDELVAAMDTDLERSVAKVEAKHPGSIRRDGGVLTGFSRGAFAAPVIARMHPGRWPYLVLIEANVPLTAASLRKAGVRAVAFLAGELGLEIAGERKTSAELEAAGFPSRLIVMPQVAHTYPDDMEQRMAEALAFVLSHEHDAGTP